MFHEFFVWNYTASHNFKDGLERSKFGYFSFLEPAEGPERNNAGRPKIFMVAEKNK